MDTVVIALTAAGSLFGVFLGGWLSSRAQDKSWERTEQQHLLEIRRVAYQNFLAAVRQYVAYAQSAAAKIEALPHPVKADTLIPVFDDTGTPFRHQMEAANMGVRLVARSRATVEHANLVAHHVRQSAAARATHPAGAIPREIFESIWGAEQQFIKSVRDELGLGDLV